MNNEFIEYLSIREEAFDSLEKEDNKDLRPIVEWLDKAWECDITTIAQETTAIVGLNLWNLIIEDQSGTFKAIRFISKEKMDYTFRFKAHIMGKVVFIDDKCIIKLVQTRVGKNMERYIWDYDNLEDFDCEPVGYYDATDLMIMEMNYNENKND